MSARSHRKGRRGEQEIASEYRQLGFDAARVPNSGGLRDPGDVAGVPGVHVEVKRTERLRIYEALDQAEADAPRGHIPALHFRRNGSGWYVAIPFDDFVGPAAGGPAMNLSDFAAAHPARGAGNADRSVAPAEEGALHAPASSRPASPCPATGASARATGGREASATRRIGRRRAAWAPPTLRNPTKEVSMPQQDHCPSHYVPAKYGGWTWRLSWDFRGQMLRQGLGDLLAALRGGPRLMPPESPKIEFKHNNCATNDPCAICGERTDPLVGPEPFLEGTWELVCAKCAAEPF